MTEHAHNFINLEGEIFGDVIVVDYAGRRKRHTYWNCVCKCGAEFVESTSNLRQGMVQRCNLCRLRLLLLRTRVLNSGRNMRKRVRRGRL
jgi:hypothetical protein